MIDQKHEYLHLQHVDLVFKQCYFALRVLELIERGEHPLFRRVRSLTLCNIYAEPDALVQVLAYARKQSFPERVRFTLTLDNVDAQTLQVRSLNYAQQQQVRNPFDQLVRLRASLRSLDLND